MTLPEKSPTWNEQSVQAIDRKIAVAPMMDWTDRHCRYFLRGFSPHVLLYTEMITAAAILRGDRARLLEFDPEEHPVALQLGGSNPEELAAAARAGEAVGYDEINLNCGCPSDRVHSGSFGACLMNDPQLVADCVAAMRVAVRIPVTVKMRIGVVTGRGVAASEAIARFDEADYDALCHFVRSVGDAGSEVMIVHARKAVLGGLSPKENREIPPLRYDVVQRLKQQFPQWPMILNGGIRTAAATLEALQWCDGVMLGREAYHRPIVLAELDRVLHSRHLSGHVEAAGSEQASTSGPGASLPTEGDLIHSDDDGAWREALHDRIIDRMMGYASRELARGTRLASITRHMLGLFAGEPGAREYRRILSEGARDPNAGPELLKRASLAARRAGERMSLSA